MGSGEGLGVRGSWIGSLSVAEKELNRLGVQAENNQIKVLGPEIEGFLHAVDTEPVTIVEIKPETFCILAGKPVRIVDLLQPFTSFRVTAGLPVAKSL